MVNNKYFKIYYFKNLEELVVIKNHHIDMM